MVAPVPVPIGEGPKEILAQHEVALACQHVVDDAWSRLSEVVTRVVDEEDGVFLYKLTRIAQAYPEVMQCVTERRAAVVASLQSQLDPVRTALVHRVKTALDDLSELQYEVWRKREAERNLAAAEKLDRQRLAASIELAHKDIEANLRMRKELRAKEKAWEQKLIAELDKVSSARLRRPLATPAFRRGDPDSSSAPPPRAPSTTRRAGVAPSQRGGAPHDRRLRDARKGVAGA